MDTISTEIGKSVLQQGPLFAVLLAIIVTGIRATWVPGFAYRQMKEERDQALATLDKFVGLHEDQARALLDVSKRLERIERELEAT